MTKEEQREVQIQGKQYKKRKQIMGEQIREEEDRRKWPRKPDSEDR